ncbi:hypothetical protein [Psychrobacter sp. DAB_AL62B]|uniref:hypothetical protein n=1 Tax=Psychrobacter sp. DAB_AL62B TaxID=1028420 RepID=UPI00025718DB|nr:hypothetical protein [Psychrobacter sp. DAB_AL62B]AFD62191.1 hypothetical protein [Psychrobacter sp. DAB_AL62B]MDE4456186.1 hypothetical protein [Psychrobacter sp. DAB_AL62B]
MSYKSKDLNEKALWYYSWGNFLAVLCTIFGIVPAVLGFIVNELELFYQGLNFFVISFALLMALRSGYLVSDRMLMKGWKHWLELNKDKTRKIDTITCLVMILVFILLALRDFYGINQNIAIFFK